MAGYLIVLIFDLLYLLYKSLSPAMYETEDFMCLLPEDEYENHLTTLNKSSLQLYQLSLRKSNHVSQTLLEDVWETNERLFNEQAMDTIISSAHGLLQDTETSDIATWKTGLHKYQSSTSELCNLFEQSVPPCELCSSSQNLQDTKTLEKFFNITCKCDLHLVDTSLKKPENSKSSKSVTEKSEEVIYLSPGSSQESLTEERYFRPKFGRTKPTKTYLNLRDQGDFAPPETKSYDYEKPQFKRTNNKERTFDYEELPIKERNHKRNTEVDFEKEEEENRAHKSNVAKITFKTAKEQLLASNPAAKRTLGATRKAQAKFVSPMIGAQECKQESYEQSSPLADDRLKHIDPKMVELIESEIIDKGTPIGWDDIAGLSMAKSVLQEAVVWPLLRPDVFTGLRRPPKGVLLFGPPGTGKTLIGKCVASQCKATFFSISASSLTSKWIGDGEKMVRALFAVARCYQPAVIFIDEIDSLLTQRSDTEHEATRRIKTEFLVQFDGANTADEERLLVIGATNRPQSLDEAARRRLVKRLYIPLPHLQAREQIISNLLKSERHTLTPNDVTDIATQAEGYSGADMRSLCAEAAMGPIRAVPIEQIATIQREKVRPVNVSDFKSALQRVRPSVSHDDLHLYETWNNTYGQGV